MLSWFQTLTLSDYLTYKDLEKDFIAAFSKTRLKHDVLSQIHAFKQKSDKSVRDGANCLRKYLTRCPVEEIPSQEILVSIFLEGLSYKELHTALYMKHHTNVNQCIHDAIDYDDNCGEELKGKDTISKTSASTSSVASQVKEITKGVMEKIQHLYGMPKLMDPQRMDRLGPIVARLDGHLALWCDFDKKWGKHIAEECYNCIRFMRTQQMGGNV